MRINKLGSLQIITASICFGALPLLTTLSYRGGANVISILAIRFTIASLLIWLYLAISKTKIKVTLKQLAIFSVVAIFFYGGMAVSYFESFRYIPSSMAAMIMFIYPVLVTYLSSIFLKSPITRAKLIALFLVTIGAVIMSWGEIAFQPLGIGLAILAAVLYAVYILFLGSPLTFQQTPQVLTGFISVFSAIFFIVLGLLRGDLILQLSQTAWIAIVLMAVLSTVFAIITFYAGVRKIGPSLAAIISTVEPITALFLGVFVLGEEIIGRQWLGALLILVGVIYIQWPGPKPKIDWKARI